MINQQLAHSEKTPSLSRELAAPSPAIGKNTMSQKVCVDIYVAEHCFVCEYSHEVAAFIRNEFPNVQLRVIDVGDPQANVPDSVFATPTYMLNGKLWSLGNPSNEDVIQRLEKSNDTD